MRTARDTGPRRFEQQSHDLGPAVNVDDIADVTELIEDLGLGRAAEVPPKSRRSPTTMPIEIAAADLRDALAVVGEWDAGDLSPERTRIDPRSDRAAPFAIDPRSARADAGPALWLLGWRLPDSR
jgi:hypothetical protein